MSLEGQLQPKAIAIQFGPIPPIACQPFRTSFRKFLFKEGFEETSADALTDVFRTPRTPCVSVNHIAGRHPEVVVVLAAPEQFPFKAGVGLREA